MIARAFALLMLLWAWLLAQPVVGPAQQAGNNVFSGTNLFKGLLPTLATGQGAIGGSGSGGLNFQGVGAAADLSFLNKNGNAALTLATGTTNWTMPGSLLINGPAQNIANPNALKINPSGGNFSTVLTPAFLIANTTGYAGSLNSGLGYFNSINTTNDVLDCRGANRSVLHVAWSGVFGSVAPTQREAGPAKISA